MPVKRQSEAQNIPRISRANDAVIPKPCGGVVRRRLVLYLGSEGFVLGWVPVQVKKEMVLKLVGGGYGEGKKTHLETLAMTLESCWEPMTDTFALGHIQRKRGEYCHDMRCE